MSRPTRYDDIIYQELNMLIAESPPYSLSCPTYGETILLNFVKGLIIATNIIKVISKYIPHGYHADWGHIIDKKSGNFMSHESDIIIYKGPPGCKIIENQSMRFVLVDKDQTRVVIQVKSSIDSVRESDRTYCRELLKYVPQVWFLAECCWAKNLKRVKNVEAKLKNAGYKKFIYFYTRNEKAKLYYTNYPLFKKFIESIKRIK